jgi:two-component SAPR family response regulator
MLKIGVVDDIDILRAMFHYMMKDVDGVVLSEYENAYQVLDRYADYEDDLLFVDYAMPYMNGTKLAKKLCENHDTKICYMTSHDEKDLYTTHKNVIRIFKKPVEVEKIYSFINEFKEKHNGR